MIARPILKGYLAGICISIGSMVYLSSPDKIIGSLFFCVALLSICYMKLSLFTGNVGFIVNDFSRKMMLNVLFGLIGNIIGVVSIGSISNFDTFISQMSANLIIDKMSGPLYITFFKAVMCGILMYISVWIFRKKQSIIGIIFCIPTFLISGFEHSIADIFYISASGLISWNILFFIIIVI